jgi:hypothetical protein
LSAVIIAILCQNICLIHNNVNDGERMFYGYVLKDTVCHFMCCRGQQLQQLQEVDQLFAFINFIIFPRSFSKRFSPGRTQPSLSGLAYKMVCYPHPMPADRDHIRLSQKCRAILSPRQELERYRMRKLGNMMLIVVSEEHLIARGSTKASRKDSVFAHSAAETPNICAKRSLQILWVSSRYKYTPIGLDSKTGRNCSANSCMVRLCSKSLSCLVTVIFSPLQCYI